MAEWYLGRKEGSAGERYCRGLMEQDPGNELARYGLAELIRLKGDRLATGQEYRTCPAMNTRWVVRVQIAANTSFYGTADANGKCP